jgi:hypothetical protein
MCNVCYAIKNKISMIDASPSTLCPNHYQDWVDEKGLGGF